MMNHWIIIVIQIDEVIVSLFLQRNNSSIVILYWQINPEI